MADRKVMPLLAWHPGPSPCGSPNEARRPTPTREVAYVSVGTEAPNRPKLPTNIINSSAQRSQFPMPPDRLDAAYSQLESRRRSRG
jgi:hypothetical protein